MTNPVIGRVVLALSRAAAIVAHMIARIALLLMVFTQPLCAEVRAVVVGVGDYLTLDADLRGPPQDAALMAETLLARGVAPGAMQVLGAAAVPAGVRGGIPTRAGIMAALADVAEAAQPGDTVVFYFSGHGAQAPDASGDEGGGSDEILLPADAAGWSGARQAVQNAIVDDELQVWAAGLLRRGVAVVGIVDACHSATGFRAVGGAGVARNLTGGDLGIPEPLDTDGQELLADALQGDFVFLYAAQSDQRAFEYPVGDSGIWHGAFTLALAQALSAANGASWAQVLAAAADAMVQGPVRQEPEGEGPLLNRVVFGTGSAVTRYRVVEGRVQAGLLQGLADGAEVALYAKAAGGAVLGQGVLDRVTLRQSSLHGAGRVGAGPDGAGRNGAGPGGAGPDGAVPDEAGPGGAGPGGAAWAEVVMPGALAAVGLAGPVRADDGAYLAWETALAPYVGGAGDLVPVLIGGGVALAGADGVLDPVGPGSSPRIRLEGGESSSEAVARVMGQAAHAIRLRKMLAGAAGRSLTGGPVLDVAYARRQAVVQGARCGAPGPQAPIAPGDGFAPCDQVWITVTNRGTRPIDVSVLYFNADFTVAPIWPQRGLANRLAPGEAVRAGLQIAPDAGFAAEEVMILGVPVEPGGARVDLTVLAEPGVSRGGPAAGWFAGRLEGDRVRGFGAKPALTLVRQAVRVRPGE